MSDRGRTEEVFASCGVDIGKEAAEIGITQGEIIAIIALAQAAGTGVDTESAADRAAAADTGHSEILAFKGTRLVDVIP